MCVAVPGKVIKIDGSIAEVDFQGNIVRAQAGLVSVKPGDRVLVHAGCILQKMTEQDSKMLEDLFAEVEAAAGE